MGESDKKVEQANTRWWESYLVRYFLGFIVGSLCVVVLANELGVVDRLVSLLTNSEKDKSFVAKPDWTAVVLIVAFLGMGFCYLASTPITVLHAGRYGRGPVDSLSRYFWFGWVLALIITLIFGAVEFRFPVYRGVIFILFSIFSMLILGLYKSRHCNSLFPQQNALNADQEKFNVGGALSKPEHHTSQAYDVMQSLAFCFAILTFVGFICSLWGRGLFDVAFRFFVFGLPVIWIGVVQYAILFRLLRDGAKLNEFYSFLFHARRQIGSRDVRDTYTHLREHSNSIFVVLIELCWLSLVLGFIRISEPIASHSNFGINDAWLTALLMAVGVWVLPTVFMWSRANAMERFFAESSDVFLVAPTPPAVDASAQKDPNLITEEEFVIFYRKHI